MLRLWRPAVRRPAPTRCTCSVMAEIVTGATAYPVRSRRWTGRCAKTCWRVRTAAADLLTESGEPSQLVADEGGFAARLAGNEAGVELVVRAIERGGLRPGEDAAVAIDFAATHFHEGGRYRLRAESRA